MTYFGLLYDVVQWITSRNKNRMATRVITLWRVHVTSLTMSVSTVRLLFERLFILKAITPILKDHMDKQNLTLMVILYEIYETRQRV